MNDRKSQETARVQTQSSSDLPQKLFGPGAREVPVGRMAVARQNTGIGPLPARPPIPIAKQIVRKHKETMTLVEIHSLPIKFLGFRKIPESYEVFHGPDNDWVLMNILDDPLFIDRNERLPVPPAIERDIKRMNAVGIDFPGTFIAHAVSPGAMKDLEEVPLELVKPLPHADVQARLALLDRCSTRLRQGVGAAVKGIGVVGAAISTAALAAPTLLAAVLPAAFAVGATAGSAAGAAVGSVHFFDPILFGVQTFDGWTAEDNQPIGSWYYLTHWFWTVEEV